MKTRHPILYFSLMIIMISLPSSGQISYAQSSTPIVIDKAVHSQLIIYNPQGIVLESANYDSGKYDYAPSILQEDDGTFKMWWTRELEHTGHGHDVIFFATSYDGLTWNNAQQVLQASDLEGENPASQEKIHAAGPSVVKVNGTYYMFYESNKISDINGVACDEQIFAASSNDGIIWNKYPNNTNPTPVIYLNGTGTQNGLCVNYIYGVGHQSLYYKDGYYYMFFLDKFTPPYDHNVRWGRSQNPFNWGVYSNYSIIAKGREMDFKWNNALNKGITVVPSVNIASNNVQICAFTFNVQNGTEFSWDSLGNIPDLNFNCTYNAGYIVADTPTGKFRMFPGIVSNREGIILDSTMQIIYGEEPTYPGTDYNQWDLFSSLFVLGTDNCKIPLHRYWNSQITDHFYTINLGNLGIAGSGYFLERMKNPIVYKSTICGDNVPDFGNALSLYRYWNSTIGDHFYTTNWYELGNGAYGYTYEVVEGYVLPIKYPSADPQNKCGIGYLPLLRYWNPTIGDHFYTTNWFELGNGGYGYSFEFVIGCTPETP